MNDMTPEHSWTTGAQGMKQLFARYFLGVYENQLQLIGLLTKSQSVFIMNELHKMYACDILEIKRKLLNLFSPDSPP